MQPCKVSHMIYTDFDIRPLAAAVIVQAMKDAREGDRNARQWLQHEGLLFFDVCGVPVECEHVKRWIKRGCKIPNRGGIHLGM